MPAVMLAACSGSRRDARAVEADSLTVDTVHVPTVEELTLADTAYASASALSFVVENADSLPALLTDYDDRYAREDRVMTFRKNLLRNADFGGRVEGTPTEIEVAWSYDTPYGRAETRTVGRRNGMDRTAPLRALDGRRDGQHQGWRSTPHC